MTIPAATPGPKWIKAAAVGSIWAAIEIIAGSFLHNLHIPFSGSMLAMAAVYLLVAFSMHYKEPGIIIRAGLIAALMKSISPSAIILGPMVGIMMEALILEVILLAIGRNLTGFVIGGMLAVTWALVQKVLNLLILYGFDLVRIAGGFYQFLVKITGLDQISPIHLIMIVVFIYAFLGATAAIAGYVSFRKGVSKGSGMIRSGELNRNAGPFDNNNEKQKYASLNIFLIIAFLALTLFFLNSKRIIPALLTGTAIITFSLIRYNRSMRYLKKPGLWVQLALITFLAAMIWEWINTGKLFSAEGLFVGLEINFRALVIIFSFSSVSVELRNPVVKNLLYRNGLSNLYKSISMAFATLPSIINRIPSRGNIFKYRRNILGNLLHLASELENMMQVELIPHKNIFIITGKVQEGKTSYLEKLVKKFKPRNIKTGGFIARGTFKEGRRTGFILHDLSGETSIPIASKKKQPGWIKFRSFYFNPDSFKAGEKFIKNAIQTNKELFVIDEVGPIEMEGKGWLKVIRLLEKTHATIQIWTVRESYLKEVMDRWQIPEENVCNISHCNGDDFFKRITFALDHRHDT
ncbi:MAG: hypothetical protein K9J30_12760 [Bacteroidales bacterium]|nr:hypothetical protein [Bacteroidales bacterium]